MLHLAFKWTNPIMGEFHLVVKWNRTSAAGAQWDEVECVEVIGKNSTGFVCFSLVIGNPSGASNI